MPTIENPNDDLDLEPDVHSILTDEPPPAVLPFPVATPAEVQRWTRRADGAVREAEADALTAGWLADNEPTKGQEAPRPEPKPYKPARKLTPQQEEEGPKVGVATSPLKLRCQASLDRTPAEIAALIEGQRTLLAGIVDKAIENGSKAMRQDLIATGNAELAAAEREFDQTRNPFVEYNPLAGRHGGFTAFVTGRLKGAVQLERSLHIGPVNGRLGAVQLDKPMTDDEGEESTFGAQLSVDADGIARLPDAARGAMADQFVDDGGPTKLEKLQVAFSTLTDRQQEALAARHEGGERQMLSVVAAGMGITETVASGHCRKGDAAIERVNWQAISAGLTAEKRAGWAARLGLPVTDWRVQDNAVANDSDLREAEWLRAEREAYRQARASMSPGQRNVRAAKCLAAGLMGFYSAEHRKPDATGVWVRLTAADAPAVTLTQAIVDATTALVAGVARALPAMPHRTELAVPALEDGMLCGRPLSWWAAQVRPSSLRRVASSNPKVRILQCAGLVGAVQVEQRRLKAEKRAKSKSVSFDTDGTEVTTSAQIKAEVPILPFIMPAVPSIPPAWALAGLAMIRPALAVAA